MLKSSLCDYSDVKEKITITGDPEPEPGPDAARTAAKQKMKEIKK